MGLDKKIFFDSAVKLGLHSSSVSEHLEAKVAWYQPKRNWKLGRLLGR